MTFNSLLKRGSLPLMTWILITLTGCNHFQARSNTIIDYKKIKENKKEIIQSLKTDGCVWIKNVPNYKTKRLTYLNAFKKFMDLPEEKRNQFIPKEFYAFGYSPTGSEYFSRQPEKYKSSLYFDSKNPRSKSKSDPNWNKFKWPSKELENAALAMAGILHEVIMKVVEAIDLVDINLLDPLAKGRCLHYKEISKDDKRMLWGQEHRDHGAFTALLEAGYLQNGKWVPKPEGSGLYVNNKPIDSVPGGILIQVGESAELLTNGQITATPHYIVAAPGFERITLPVFKNVESKVKMYSTVTKYNNRFHNGITFEDYANNTFNMYYNLKQSKL